MAFEDLERQFEETDKDVSEIEEEIEDEIDDLFEDYSRGEILEMADHLDDEFQEHVKTVLDMYILRYYSDLLREGEELNAELEEALEELKEKYGRNEILLQIDDMSDEFREKVRNYFE
ncbi:hypothetical protein [Candidatus Nanohalovita haloferacivicina]|uniref:hypothetical protein n=1 Tax=Candidatus Nanohalovita haloferacivicina TaxID=2978046 RepID=UPI00325FA5E9|nr:hypothetical protein HBNXNv_1143 [Candidatus Nanohalobia archaeon BNXNv]